MSYVHQTLTNCVLRHYFRDKKQTFAIIYEYFCLVLCLFMSKLSQIVLYTQLDIFIDEPSKTTGQAQ